MPSRRRRLVAGSVSVAIAQLAIVLGALDGLVWMPQAVAPTTPLPKIYRALQHSGDLVGCVASIVLWGAFWRFPVALAVTLLCLPDRMLGDWPPSGRSTHCSPARHWSSASCCSSSWRRSPWV